MNEQLREQGGQDFVAPDESKLVTDPEKARVMADASDSYRTAERDYLAEQRKRQEREARGGTKLSDYIDDFGAKAKEEGQRAENTEHFAGLHYEADRIVDAVGQRVSVESVYNQELRMIEANRDAEAFKRVLEQLSSRPEKSEDVKVLERLTRELTDNAEIQGFAFSKLHVKAQERFGGRAFWDKYNAFKASEQEMK